MPSRLPQSRGFSLIELSIVLLIAGLLTAGIFGITSNIQKQRTDQATANEMRTVVTALERYLVDNQGALTAATTTPSLACIVGSPPPTACPKFVLLTNIVVTGHAGANEAVYFQANYLPGGTPIPPATGIDITSGTSYVIGLRNIGPITASTNTNAGVNLRGLVLRNLQSTVDDSRLARIAALVGTQGGMIPAVLTGQAANKAIVSGVYGAWQVLPSDYAFTGSAGGVNQSILAGYTNTVDSQINTNLLSRIYTGNPEANTMETDLNMGTNSVVTSSVASNPAGIVAPAMITDAFGIAILSTTATLNTSCTGDGTGTNFTITTVDPAGTYTYDLQTASTWVANAARLQNAVVQGLDAISNATLLQCRQVGATSSWTWQTAISQNSESAHTFIQAGDPHWPFVPFQGIATWGQFVPRGAVNNTIFYNSLSSSSPSYFSATTHTSRIVDQWFQNDSKNPMFLNLAAREDPNNLTIQIYVRNKLSNGTFDYPMPVLYQSGTNNGAEFARTFSATIPPSALYGVHLTSDGGNQANDNQIILWSEVD